MPSQNHDDWKNDSSNWAVEGYGIPELIQLQRKPKAEQEIVRAKLAGSTTEVPNDKIEHQPH